MATGQGTFIMANGERYEGAFENGYLTGYGTFYYTNGNRYEGDWLDSEKHGNGHYIYANGDRYIGKWQNGTRVEGKLIKKLVTQSIEIKHDDNDDNNNQKRDDSNQNSGSDKKNMILIIVIGTVFILVFVCLKKTLLSDMTDFIEKAILASVASLASSATMYLVGIEAGINLLAIPIVWGITLVLSLNA